MSATSELPATRDRRDVLGVLRRHPDLVVEIALLVAAEVLLLAALAPSAAFRNVLPYGSDNTGHPYNVSELAASLRDFRLTGWAQGWFAGFPTGVLYPVLAPGIAAVGSLITPLAVSYKLTVLAGPLLLPPCAYLAARLARLPRAYPVLLAVFTLPFLFDVSCSVCGGSIESTVLGEYAYSWGLAFGLLALGATVRLCDGAGSRWWPPLLLGIAALGHPVTAIWTAAGVVLILGHSWLFQRRAPRRAGIPVVLAVLLAAIWWLPFLADHQFMPEPLEPKYTLYLSFLFPASWPWEIVLTALAAGGAFWAYRNRQLLLVGLASLSVLAALGFRFLPQSVLSNWRVVELWSLGLWMLAAVGCLEGVRWLIARVPLARIPRWFAVSRLSDGQVRYAVVGAALLVVALAQGVPWGLWPGESFVSSASPHEHWLGLDFPAVPQAEYPARVFGGAPVNPDAAQYDAMISMLEAVARHHGCGRVASDEDVYGLNQVHYYNDLDSLPLITHGCLATILGTLSDSGDNVPAMFFAESLASVSPELSIPDIPYPKFNLPDGISFLRQLGVTYYLTHGGPAESAARRQPDLRLVGSTAQVQAWEISDAGVVAPLSNRPVVVASLPSNVSWEHYYLQYALDFVASGLASEWGRVLDTQNGPASWPREPAFRQSTSAALPRVTVSHVSVTDATISFDVSRVGVPVEVRDTYFPGWQVHGGSGPYRAMPDFMVVVPSSTHVTLAYTTTGVITTGDALGGLGLVGVAVLGFADTRRRRATPAPAAKPHGRPGGAPAKAVPAKAVPAKAASAKAAPAKAAPRKATPAKSGGAQGARAKTGRQQKRKSPGRGSRR
jgi:hypothetical protein